MYFSISVFPFFSLSYNSALMLFPCVRKFGIHFTGLHCTIQPETSF